MDGYILFGSLFTTMLLLHLRIERRITRLETQMKFLREEVSRKEVKDNGCKRQSIEKTS